jgi:tetratricopeptide (TPR) repeat protein
MDCRKPLVLFLGLLAGIGGCTQTLPGVRLFSSTQAKTDEAEMVHKAPTYVAFGDFRASSAQSKEQTPAQRDQYRDEARLSYLKAIELDPKYLPAYVALARFQQRCEDYAGAVAVYQKALELAPRDASLWFEVGMCQCRMKDWGAAVVNMRKALELEPGNRKFASITGFTLARAGLWEEAFAVLAQANGEARAHYDVARMLRHLNRRDEARRHALSATVKDPNLKAARELLNEIDNPRPAPAPAVIQTTSYTEPADPAQVSSSASTDSPAMPKIITPRSLGAPVPPPAKEEMGKPIRIPPPPRS